MEEHKTLLWQAFLSGYLHAQGRTTKDLTAGDTGWGGENQLKEAFAKWYAEKTEQASR